MRGRGGGGGLKGWYHHLIRAMISLVKQTKSSVVEKLRICQLFGKLSHE